MSHQQDLQQVVDFYQSLTPDTLKQVDLIYTADAYFKDPFNEVRGFAAITSIFRHMFAQLDAPHFVIAEQVLQNDSAFLTWEFHFRMKRFVRREQCIRGASHLRFATNGRVCFHRDYWDAAEELYEKLPLLGGLMRVLKRAGGAGR